MQRAVIVLCFSRLCAVRCLGLLAVFFFSLVSSIFSLKVSLFASPVSSDYRFDCTTRHIGWIVEHEWMVGCLFVL